MARLFSLLVYTALAPAAPCLIAGISYSRRHGFRGPGPTSRAAAVTLIWSIPFGVIVSLIPGLVRGAGC